ncbi:hypothetical protein D3C81_965650 [compost metagenome]
MAGSLWASRTDYRWLHRQATVLPVGAALCRDGLQSSPGNLCFSAEILGLLCSPSRHKAAPTRSAMKPTRYLASDNQAGSYCPFMAKFEHRPALVVVHPPPAADLGHGSLATCADILLVQRTDTHARRGHRPLHDITHRQPPTPVHNAGHCARNARHWLRACASAARSARALPCPASPSPANRRGSPCLLQSAHWRR